MNFYVWGILVRGIQATNAPLKENPGFQFISSSRVWVQRFYDETTVFTIRASTAKVPRDHMQGRAITTINQPFSEIRPIPGIEPEPTKIL